MVADHYSKLGFRSIENASEGQTSWAWDIPEVYSPGHRSIVRTSKSAAADETRTGSATVVIEPVGA
jgi:hypothetical protein